VKVLKTKNIITRLSSFLLLTIVMGHLVFIERNTLVESVLIILALGLSFIVILIQKAWIAVKGMQVVKG
jgi:hypothetical protein